jgi:hypothetical protein
MKEKEGIGRRKNENKSSRNMFSDNLHLSLIFLREFKASSNKDDRENIKDLRFSRW